MMLAKSLDEAPAGFNFGAIHMAQSGALTFELIDGHGRIVHTLNLKPRSVTAPHRP